VVPRDVVTESVLVIFFGGPVHVDRLNGFMNPGYRWSISSAWERPDEVASYSPCGFLVLNFRPGPWKQHRSHYGPLSGHWVADRADPTVRMPAGLRETVPLLRAHGWTKTFVPPFYWYYEPPPPGPRASSAAAP
jgi:hypothetical protein